MRALRYRKGKIIQSAKKNGGCATHNEAIFRSFWDNAESEAEDRCNFQKVTAAMESKLISLENSLAKLSDTVSDSQNSLAILSATDDYYDSYTVSHGEEPVTENMIVEELHLVDEAMIIACGPAMPRRESYGPN